MRFKDIRDVRPKHLVVKCGLADVDATSGRYSSEVCTVSRRVLLSTQEVCVSAPKRKKKTTKKNPTRL